MSQDTSPVEPKPAAVAPLPKVTVSPEAPSVKVVPHRDRDWETTKKTTGFTATSGVGYFCDTTSAAFTVTLPATPSAGNVVAVSDYNGTAGTNNITIARNGSNINGSASDFEISKDNSSIQFIYLDATVGWQSVFSGNITDTQNSFVVASGGTETFCGDYKIHTFTGPGTFCVSNAGNALGSTTVDYLVVASDRDWETKEF